MGKVSVLKQIGTDYIKQYFHIFLVSSPVLIIFSYSIVFGTKLLQQTTNLNKLFLKTNVFIMYVTLHRFQAWKPKPNQSVTSESQKTACRTKSTKLGTGRTTYDNQVWSSFN